MTIGSLFSGIGGLELGLERAGLGPVVWQVEQKETSRAVLAEHWPTVARFEDVHEVGRHNLFPVDLICGGFPCQDISAAGTGKGLSGSRSGLWYQFARIVDELQPRWVVVENVASGARRWVDAVVSHLGQLGYETLPVPLQAADVGAPHRRARIFLVARRMVDADRDGRTQGDRAREPSRGEEHSPTSRASGPAGRLADCDGRRWESVRQSEHERVKGEPGPVAHRRGDDGDQFIWPPGPLDDEGWQAYVARGGPEPALLRGTHGIPQRMDRSATAKAWRAGHRARIEALGNSVVPQCAEVVGWIVRELIEGGERG